MIVTGYDAGHLGPRLLRRYLTPVTGNFLNNAIIRNNLAFPTGMQHWPCGGRVLTLLDQMLAIYHCDRLQLPHFNTPDLSYNFCDTPSVCKGIHLVLPVNRHLFQAIVGRLEQLSTIPTGPG